MAASYGKSKGRKEAGGFSMFLHVVEDHPDFLSLSGGALKVLHWLVRQYNGKNNGNLSATITQLKHRGIASTATLKKALDELQAKNLIVRTREGRFLNPGGRCALYAVTWFAIDECRGADLEVNATRAPLRSFAAKRTERPLQLVKSVDSLNEASEAGNDLKSA